MITRKFKHEGKYYITVPVNLLEYKLSPRDIFIYCKILAMGNSSFSLSTLGRTPGKVEYDLNRNNVSLAVHNLEQKGLLHIEKTYIPGKVFANYQYTITGFEGYFKMIYIDLINNKNLSLNAKGFAILLTLLQSIPNSYSAMETELGITDKSCKKYYTELKKAGIIAKDNTISLDYVPRFLYDAQKKKYEQKFQELAKITGSRRIQNQIKWINETELSYNWKFKKLLEVESGVFARPKASKEINKIINLLFRRF